MTKCTTTTASAASGNATALLARLDSVRGVGDRKWEARCPAHDDQRASLSVSEASDGTLLVHCHAGCQTSDVLAAVGLKMSDLFPRSSEANGKPRVVATYGYRDADGVLVLQVVRFSPKDFRQRRPDGNGGWTWSVRGCPALPYRLPELLAADPSAPVFIVEGEKDVDRLRSIGLTATCNAGGAGKWKAEHAKYLAGRSVVILPDNDDPGRKHAQQVAKSLAGTAASVRIVDLPGLPEKGDVSDYLGNGGTAKGLLYAASIAPDWTPTDANTGEVKQAPDNGLPGLTINYQPHGRNGSATLTAKIGDEILAHAKVDLGKPKDRAAFIESVCKRRPAIVGDKVEQELLRIGVELAGRNAKGDDDDQPDQSDAAVLLANMPEHVRGEARGMLASPDLMKIVIDDVASCGVAGERELVAAIYLVGVSRLLPRPLAAIVQAPSSTGKSYVVEKTAALFPDETVIHATAMTAQSLYYLEPGALQHRFIVAGERSRREDDDQAEATRALREMISSGRLSKLVPMKEGGKIVTQRIEQPGPISYVGTTTLTRIFDEDANRCLLLSADERHEQTKAVVNRLAGGYSGAASGNVDAIVQRHHAAQRVLQQRPVVVPFAQQIADTFDVERVEARRAFPHLMGMIQASAILHQRQRTIDGEGRIVASVDDYQLARHLVRGPLARLLGGRISDAALRFHDRLAAWVGERFTTTEAVKRDRKSKQAVTAWIKELCEAGALEQIDPPKGNRPAVWKLTGIDRNELVLGDSGLPESVQIKV